MSAAHGVMHAAVSCVSDMVLCCFSEPIIWGNFLLNLALFTLLV